MPTRWKQCRHRLRVAVHLRTLRAFAGSAIKTGGPPARLGCILRRTGRPVAICALARFRERSVRGRCPDLGPATWQRFHRRRASTLSSVSEGKEKELRVVRHPLISESFSLLVISISTYPYRHGSRLYFVLRLMGLAGKSLKWGLDRFSIFFRLGGLASLAGRKVV
jgi:hypothetical protein